MYRELKALGQRRPPLQKQIITPIMLNVWRTNSKYSGSLPAPQSGHATAIIVLFAHLLMLEDLDHHEILEISSSLYRPGPLHKISS